ncbi:cytochrome C peroxidase [Chryseobacterium indologenes]|uniref:cytochrome-c peroxidase n=1 Tax=Chryseobacterium indologenes TaxID=253 RepID=UPI000BFCD9F9|nr:cytochrome c peroxidase [Chryseobacterium indologenes]ATN04464.1 cytochrome C peroxidase [Chryseobacterium indologenes]AYY86786.1 cytochrome C peroxidase [Chryseobacterium indologenes]QIX79766.1 c-type cytochrome [Chryseobacterium indologenes]UDQ53396.1 c-type cytochrome [Chryseobacterium indologenes]
MKKLSKYPILLFLYCAAALFILSYCKNEKPQVVYEDLGSVKKEILNNNSVFEKQINELIGLVSKDADEKALQQKFQDLRKTYKKMEWAVEYFLPHSARFINGAALPEIEMDEHTEIEPEGLQVLEEMFYPYEKQNKEEVIRFLRKLINKSNTIATNFQVITVSKNQAFDAVRQEVFRISSLGISGFDTPVSGTFLEEIPYSLSGVQHTLEQISTQQSKDKSLQAIISEISSANAFLKKNTDKNTFDYVNFIPDHLNKITALLQEFKKQEQIQDVEVTTALNKNAATFFSKNAFNPNAFTPGEEFAYSDEKARLGHQLFNDKILSNNNNRSCATCHIPEKAFTDGLARSMSLENAELARNAPSLNYAGFQHGQFWDMRKDDLEGQSSDVISNKEEMHGDLNVILAKINQDKKYKEAFQKIYQTQKTEVWQLQNVLASYIRSLPTFNSNFDDYMRGNKSAMTESQKRGFNLFVGKAQCAICHFLPLFNGTVPPTFKKTEQEVLGVAVKGDNRIFDRDPGRGKFHETVAILQHSFKTPTLRNINKTAPYMHNGGYRTLKEVMNFYNKGGGKGFGFAVENQTLSDTPLQLTDKEIDDIIDFMKALDDR